jgi:hypothetical protein
MTQEGDLEGKSFAIAPDWRGRAFALLRYVAFVVLAAAAANFANTPALHRPLHSVEQHWLLSMTIICATSTALIFLMARLSGRPFGSLGYAGPRGLRNLGIGLVAGIAPVAAQLTALWLLGDLDWGPVLPQRN